MMKNEIDQAENQAENLPFPSHVTQPCPNEQAREQAATLHSTQVDIQNVMQSAGNVHYYVRPHVVLLDVGVYGIESLIAYILKTRQAVFARGAEHTALRGVVVAASMTAEAIHNEVVRINGEGKYPLSTIRQYLTTEMRGKVVGFKLLSAEDKARPSKCLRNAWYLLNTVGELPLQRD